MDVKEVEKEMEELGKKIRYYNKAFFQDHRSLISDYDFDQLVLRLTTLEKEFPSLKKPDSPTNHLGEEKNKGFASIKHLYPMRSLGNTYAIEEVQQFAKRLHKLLPEEPLTYFCELKFDGVAISARYHKGVLQHVVTRGDGVEGDDVTANGRRIKTIPPFIKDHNVPDYLEVRGEVFMTKKSFHTLNKKHMEAGKATFANPRNTASGTLKTLDSELVAERNLSFCPYTLLGEEIDLPTQAIRIEKLTEWGFSLSPTYQMCENIEEVIAYLDKWGGDRESLPMEIDGVVIKVNEIAHQKQLGATSKTPRWAIAYKYKAKSATALLEEVLYQVGRTGVITPVAKLSPTRLAGSTIQRASLHNQQEIATLGLQTQDTVFLEKGGDVIPKILAVDLTKRKEGSEPIHFISHCPSCETSLVKEEGSAHHYCPNQQGCPSQLKGKLSHFVHRQAMNIAHLGKRTIALLFKKGIIKHPADLYKLTAKDFLGLEGFKEKSIQNILVSIEISKKKPFEKVLFALGIRHVGATIAGKLVTHFCDIDRLTQASLEELISLPGMGEQIAESLSIYFNNEDEIRQLENLHTAGLQMSQEKIVTPLRSSEELKGKNFVITGTFKDFSREEMKSYILHHGGRTLTALSSKAGYLVRGEEAGSKKLVKAAQLGVEVIDIDALKLMIGG